MKNDLIYLVKHIEETASNGHAYYHIKHSYKKNKYEVQLKSGKWQFREVHSPYKGEWFVSSDIIVDMNNRSIDLHCFHKQILDQIQIQVVYNFNIKYDYNFTKRLLNIFTKLEIKESLDNWSDFEKSFKDQINKIINKPSLKIVD